MGHEREIHPHRILAAAVRMEKLPCHICHPRIQSSVVELHCVKALRHGQEKKKSAFGMSPRHAFRHIFLQKAQQQIPLSLIKQNRPLKILIQPSAFEKFRRDILVKYRRAEVQGLLAHIYLVQQLWMSNCPAETETGSEYLRERPQMDHAVRRKRIHCRHRFSFISEFPVRTVLHYKEIVFRSQIHKHLSFLQGKRLS